MLQGLTVSDLFFRDVAFKSSAKAFTTSIYCFDGDGPAPEWVEEDQGKL